MRPNRARTMRGHAPTIGTHRDRARPSRGVYVAAAVGAGAMAALWAFNDQRARQAERLNPPVGRFITVRGVRVHYVEHGQGEPLVLLHGNGSMVEDFLSSGLVDECASKYRVIVIDRPGFGHSQRPRNTVWTPQAQADLVHEVLRRLGAAPAIVLGHSWGTSVAVALALRHAGAVKALVLASGYYYPTARADVPVMSGPAIPVIGDVMRYTLSPAIGRLIWPMVMRKIFGPADVPAKFRAGFPMEMALRPSQIRASAAETALMIPDAFAYRHRYHELDMPVVIIAGAQDRLVKTQRQSARLHRELPHSTMRSVIGAGHMVHQTATAHVMVAIDEAAEAAHRPRV